MSRARFTEEFKIAAVKQVVDHGRPVAEVAARLGVSTHSMYAWLKRYNTSAEQRQQDSAETAEIKRLRTEVKRLTEERDILKKAAACGRSLSEMSAVRNGTARHAALGVPIASVELVFG